MDMNVTDASALARRLYDMQGPQAIAQAAQQAERYEQNGDKEQAALWHRVEAVLREMRGPRQS